MDDQKGDRRKVVVKGPPPWVDLADDIDGGKNGYWFMENVVSYQIFQPILVNFEWVW